MDFHPALSPSTSPHHDHLLLHLHYHPFITILLPLTYLINPMKKSIRMTDTFSVFRSFVLIASLAGST